MIPLNKPGHSIKGDGKTISDLYPNRYMTYFSIGGDALNWVYQHLYEIKGCLRVGVSPLACFHAIYPIVMNGHIPVYLDVDANTYNIDIEKRDKWPQIDALEVIYLGGNPIDIALLTDWCKQKHIILIEDCAQAMGSMFNGKQLGMYGDYSIFSCVKNVYLSCGLLLTKKPIIVEASTNPVRLRIYKRIKQTLESQCNLSYFNLANWLYRNLLLWRETHGGYRNVVRLLTNKEKARIEKACLSLTELNSKRDEMYQYFKQRIDTKKYSLQYCIAEGYSNHNRFLLKVKKGKCQQVIIELRKKRLAANNLTQHYLHAYQQPIWNDEMLGKFYCKGSMPIYEQIYDKVFAIPFSPYLTTNEIDYIIKTLNKL